MPKCAATTKLGNRCTNNASLDSQFFSTRKLFFVLILLLLSPVYGQAQEFGSGFGSGFGGSSSSSGATRYAADRLAEAQEGAAKTYAIAIVIGAVVIGAAIYFSRTRKESRKKHQKNEWEKLSFENFSFKKLRDGDYGLAKTYWVFGVLISTALSIVLPLVAMAKFGLWGILLYPAVLFYSANVLIGTWHAADRYQATGFNWGLVAKCLTVLGWIGFLFHVLIFVGLIISGVGA